MELSKILSIFKLNDYHFFKQRRNGVYICFSYKNNNYARIGTVKDIHKEYIIHKMLLGNCKVPNISDLNISGEYAYYIEDKVGDSPFGLSLQNNEISLQYIFNTILDNTRSLLGYQKLNRKNISNYNYDKILSAISYNDFIESGLSLQNYTNIRIFLNYIKNTGIIEFDKDIDVCFMHGDFNLYNHCEHGIIDFEDSNFIGFSEIDLVSLLFHSVFFNFNENKKPVYTYSKKQIDKILKTYTTFIPNENIKKRIGFFILIRFFWLCSGLNKNETDILNYRLQLFNILIGIFFNKGSEAVYDYIEQKMIYLNKVKSY